MIGKKIKERREELGLSQEQLAKMLGVSKSAVGNYEVNISSPKETVLFKLFDVLKCDANYLYEDYIVYDEDFIVTNSEKSQIKKYRQLDEYGKKAVSDLLNTEYERCTSIVEKQQEAIYISKTAARNGEPPGEKIITQEELDEIRSRPDADPDM